MSSKIEMESADKPLTTSTTLITDILNDIGFEKSSELDNFSSADMKLADFEEKIIIFIFSTVIIFGVMGNALVIWTVLFNRQMRTSNNIFVLNLAISDLTLCLFSIPFNVYKTLRHSWKFGDFLCKFSPFFQASNVFVSTISITAIALDRYVHIVHSINVRHSNKSSSIRSMLILILMWLLAFFLSSPLLFFNRLESIIIKLQSNDTNYLIENSTIISSSSSSFSSSSLNDPDSSFSVDIHHCIEYSPFNQSRLIYSYASLLIQYTFPIFIVGIAYGSIWWKLKKQRNKLKLHQKNLNKPKSTNLNIQLKNSIVNQSVLIEPSNANQIHHKKKLSAKNIEKRKRLKMNLLLVFIAIIFAASWFPLNIFNILSDSKLSILKPDHTFYIINAVCILLGMSSAVSNPILYGVLNENFKREYKKIFVKLFSKVVGKHLKTSNNKNKMTEANNKILENDETIYNNNNNIELKNLSERSLTSNNNINNQKVNKNENLILDDDEQSVNNHLLNNKDNFS